MPADYYVRFSATELGPLSFRGLVRLARNGELTRDDLVRSNWEPEWRPASEVIGLFYMAGRQDIVDAWASETADNVVERDSTVQPANILPRQTEEVVEEEEQAQHSASSPLASEALRRQILAAIDEAIDRPQAQRAWPARIGRYSAVVVRHGVLWGFAAGFLALAVLAILAYSETELQRYPDAKMLAAGMKMFPGWGACSRGEFLFLACDAAVLAGLAGYAFAWGLVQHTEHSA